MQSATHRQEWRWVVERQSRLVLESSACRRAGRGTELPCGAGIRALDGAGKSCGTSGGDVEIIQVDDIRKQIVELRKLVRVVDPGQHALLVKGTVREVDFHLSADLHWVEADETTGLSFATSMQKFKSLLKLKRRFVSEVDVYAVEESTVHIDGLRFIHDRPGHVSLVVTKRMTVGDLVDKLETLALNMQPIGRMMVAT